MPDDQAEAEDLLRPLEPRHVARLEWCRVKAPGLIRDDLAYLLRALVQWRTKPDCLHRLEGRADHAHAVANLRDLRRKVRRLRRRAARIAEFVPGDYIKLATLLGQGDEAAWLASLTDDVVRGLEWLGKRLDVGPLPPAWPATPRGDAAPLAPDTGRRSKLPDAALAFMYQWVKEHPGNPTRKDMVEAGHAALGFDWVTPEYAARQVAAYAKRNKLDPITWKRGRPHRKGPEKSDL